MCCAATASAYRKCQDILKIKNVKSCENLNWNKCNSVVNYFNQNNKFQKCLTRKGILCITTTTLKNVFIRPLVSIA